MIWHNVYMFVNFYTFKDRKKSAQPPAGGSLDKKTFSGHLLRRGLLKLMLTGDLISQAQKQKPELYYIFSF